MKYRRYIRSICMGVFVFAAIYLLAILLSLSADKPSLYTDCEVSDDLIVYAEFSDDRRQIGYLACNTAETSIPFDLAVLEYRTEDGWQEVLTRTFRRQSETGRTADQLFFSASDIREGILPLNQLRLVEAEAYRLVFPLTGTNSVAVSMEFS